LITKTTSETLDKPGPARVIKVNPQDLRNAFGCFGTGVTVVTTRHPGGRLVGVTANSFSPVSLDPPLVLWSLRADSPSLAAFQAAGRFAIHVLAVDQVHLSQRFSTPGADRFSGLDLRVGLGGLPLLPGCAATLECAVFSTQPAGDHMLFMGRVDRYTYQRTPPLLFCQGSYARAVELETTV
jgi:flavin reductase (DIM6/NTAB) family NADH-FMN oxidoreductase RutF